MMIFRKNLLIAVLMLPLLSLAQPKKTIDGVWGIPFGTTAQAARQIAAGKSAAYDTIVSKANTQVYTNAIFAQRNVKNIQLLYNNNALWQGIINFPEMDAVEVMPQFEAIIKELTTVYGIARYYAIFRNPYHKGADDELYAIQYGFADMGAVWTIQKQKEAPNTVELKINKDWSFTLTYTDGTRKKAVDKKKAAIKFQDY